MSLNNCNIVETVLTLFTSSRYGVSDCNLEPFKEELLKVYHNGLACETSNSFPCLDEGDDCSSNPNTVDLLCSGYISNINVTETALGVQLTAIHGLLNPPTAFTWIYDSNILRVKANTPSNTDSIELEWIINKTPSQYITDIEVSSIDLKGCKASKKCQLTKTTSHNTVMDCNTVSACNPVGTITLDSQTATDFTLSFVDGYYINITVTDYLNNVIHSNTGISNPYTVPVPLYSVQNVQIELHCSDGSISNYTQDFTCSNLSGLSLTYSQSYNSGTSEYTHTIDNSWVAGNPGDTFELIVRNITTAQQSTMTGVTGTSLKYEVICGISCGYSGSNQYTGTLVPISIGDAVEVSVRKRCTNNVAGPYFSDSFIVCSTPVISVDNITDTTAEITINNYEAGQTYTIYVNDGINPMYTVAVTSAVTTLTGLVSNTTHTITAEEGCSQPVGTISNILTFDTTDNCVTPIISLNTITDTTIEILISNVAPSHNYSVSVDNGSTFPYTGYTNSPIVITGLTPNTAYDIVVQEDCGGTDSNTVSTTTLATNPCVVPTITVSNITYSSADINITNYTPGQTYDISIDGGSTFPYTGYTAATVNLNVFAPNTSYTIVVKAQCSATQSNQVVTLTENLIAVAHMVCGDILSTPSTNLLVHLTDMAGNLITNTIPSTVITVNVAGTGNYNISVGTTASSGHYGITSLPTGVNYGAVTVIGNNKGYVNGGVVPFTFKNYQNNTASPITTTVIKNAGQKQTVNFPVGFTWNTIGILSGGVGLTDLGPASTNNC